jgi:P pilus assembly chaperone PapD
MTDIRSLFPRILLTALALAATPAARANLVLSHVILDLAPGTPQAQDIEVWNNSKERSYVVAEPVEVMAPGTPQEQRVADPDPGVLGLLVTPQRMILEPGQRRLVRVAAVLPRSARDRIYRVAIKPVAGDVTAGNTALKVMVGYDALVIYRPEKLDGSVSAQRTGGTITFRNSGNTNVEMFEGKQCDAAGKTCRALPSNRLYAGATWQVAIDPSHPVEYRIATAGQSVLRTF